MMFHIHIFSGKKTWRFESTLLIYTFVAHILHGFVVFCFFAEHTVHYEVGAIGKLLCLKYLKKLVKV